MQVAIKNPSGENLDYTWHAGHPDSRDVVVLGHGVTANKDRPFLVALAEASSAVGLAVLRFSFAGNGGSAGRFEECTVTKELADLVAVLDALEAVDDARRITYVGHSMGAAVGVLCAAQDPRIERLVSLAGMVDTRSFAERKFGNQVPGESLMWDKPECPLSQGYMDDMNAIGTVIGCADEIALPWLLVHGDADTVVPLQDSRDIARLAKRAELVELSGVDHVFSGDGTTRMVKAVVGWLAPRST